jgi:hypothetical protein
MQDTQKPVKVQGKLFWNQYMTEFNTHFNADNNKYECTLGNLSDAAVEALKSLGVNVKNKPEQGNYIVAKSKYTFDPVDEDGNKLDAKEFGNGTEAIAIVGSYRHKLSAKFGAAPSIKKLIITKVVKYDPDAAKVATTAAEDDVL